MTGVINRFTGVDRTTLPSFNLAGETRPAAARVLGSVNYLEHRPVEDLWKNRYYLRLFIGGASFSFIRATRPPRKIIEIPKRNPHLGVECRIPNVGEVPSILLLRVCFRGTVRIEWPCPGPVVPPDEVAVTKEVARRMDRYILAVALPRRRRAR